MMRGRPWTSVRTVPRGRQSGRGGWSIAEFVVSLTIFTLGATLMFRILNVATQSLEEAELGIRAAIFLSELHSAPDDAPPHDGVRPIGPGVLEKEDETDGALTVRYQPPSLGAPGAPGRVGGYHSTHRWSVRWD
jgi:hypothetical protein